MLVWRPFQRPLCLLLQAVTLRSCHSSMLACQRGALDMDESVQTTSVHDEPLCVCGYSKVGLPETDHPCPECGSTKSAVYHGSYSYYGWNVALLGAGISFAHTLFVIVCAGIDFEPPEVLFLSLGCMYAFPWEVCLCFTP